MCKRVCVCVCAGSSKILNTSAQEISVETYSWRMKRRLFRREKSFAKTVSWPRTRRDFRVYSGDDASAERDTRLLDHRQLLFISLYLFAFLSGEICIAPRRKRSLWIIIRKRVDRFVIDANRGYTRACCSVSRTGAISSGAPRVYLRVK